MLPDMSWPGLVAPSTSCWSSDCTHHGWPAFAGHVARSRPVELIVAAARKPRPVTERRSASHNAGAFFDNLGCRLVAVGSTAISRPTNGMCPIWCDPSAITASDHGLKFRHRFLASDGLKVSPVVNESKTGALSVSFLLGLDRQPLTAEVPVLLDGEDVTYRIISPVAHVSAPVVGPTHPWLPR
jgi:hypothetical protein